MTSFGQVTQTLRTRLGLTVRELAERAHVPAPLVSGVQTGNRIVGENNARKLGTALDLTGQELEDFVLQALDSATDKVLVSSQNYPAILLNLVAAKLRATGITPEAITTCARTPEGVGAVIYLQDGRRVVVHVNLDFQDIFAGYPIQQCCQPFNQNETAAVGATVPISNYDKHNKQSGACRVRMRRL